jgi:hypothetical protein
MGCRHVSLTAAVLFAVTVPAARVASASPVTPAVAARGGIQAAAQAATFAWGGGLGLHAPPPGTEPPRQVEGALAERPPDARPAAGSDLDAPERCRPEQDIACTIVRETRRGVVVVTFRPAAAGLERAAWSVISGAPAGGSAGGTPGGTIYVVPALAQNQTPPPSPNSLALNIPLPNGAPIID